MRLLLENVRGFVGTHRLDIKPLTILVGENSSGKTTLLGALAAALQTDFPSSDTFNRSPFELGSFDTIATYRGGKFGRSLSFKVGWESSSEGRSLVATFENHQGIPRVHALEISTRVASLRGNPQAGTWELIVEKANKKQTYKFKVDPPKANGFSLFDLPRRFLMRSREVARRPKESNDLFEHLFELTTTTPIACIALAPLRTRPHRTYDNLIEEFKPEGDHVPLVLARILAGDGAAENFLTTALDEFGKSSGLFDKLKVKRMGRQPSDPFQLRVKSTGPDANLVDVGYGVSQALPIIVDSILAPKNRVVLIQQPEVHLHPRAQAALGTFFCKLATDASKHFVIETHSDYLLDRVRIAVADGDIKAESVNIAFLDRKGLDVKIHQLQLDESGNIENAPPSYRKFFMEEEMRLMLRGEL